MTKKTRNNIFLLIRISLLLLALSNIFIVFAGLLTINRDLRIETLNQHSKNIENVFFALITLALTYGTEIIEKRQRIDIPDILEIVIALFIFAGICLSVQFNLYYRYFWWDDLLHALSGVILGFIGFIVVYRLNYRFSMDINPALIALFSFTFAVTFGVLWEILEFTGDVLMGTAHQKWNLPETACCWANPIREAASVIP